MIDLRNIEPLNLMPQVFRKDAKIQAASYAFRETARGLLKKIDPVAVYAAVDVLQEQIIDLLAVEFRAQYYDTSLPVEEKRKAVKKALLWHCRAGTASAVRELTDLVWRSDSAHVQEWFDYGAAPYLFRILLGTDMRIDEDKIDAFLAALWKVKNTRSHLEAIAFRRQINHTLYIGSAMRACGHIVVTDVWHDRYRMQKEVYHGVAASGIKRIRIKEG